MTNERPDSVQNFREVCLVTPPFTKNVVHDEATVALQEDVVVTIPAGKLLTKRAHKLKTCKSRQHLGMIRRTSTIKTTTLVQNFTSNGCSEDYTRRSR